MRLIIQNGTIVTSSDTFQADLLIENETIVGISKQQQIEEGDRVIDASDLYVFPGGIDVHAHLSFSGTVDDFQTGTIAAAAGGITSIINFTEPNRSHALTETLKEWKEKAQNSCIDYGFHVIINEWRESLLTEIPLLAEQGVTSIKLFMAYPGELMINDEEMFNMMKVAGENGMITNVHAENGDVIEALIHSSLVQRKTAPIYHAYTRPAELEAEATARALRIAEVAGAPIYIVHVTCGQALQEIDRAKKRGVLAFAETCPHYLILDQSYLEQECEQSAKYICSPPLREKWNQDALWKGLATGILSTVASDHSSIPYDGAKAINRNNFSKIPNGCPGIEDLFSLIYHYGVYEQRISLQKFVEVTSTGPAKLFGMHPRKGTISVGSDADLVLFDPHARRTITKDNQYQQTDYNLYEGFSLQGRITSVISRGEEIVKDGVFVGESGRGHYLFRKKFTNT